MSGPTLFALSSAIRQPAHGVLLCPLCPPWFLHCRRLPGQPTEPQGRRSRPSGVGGPGSRRRLPQPQLGPRCWTRGARSLSQNFKAGHLLDLRCTEWSLSPCLVHSGLLSFVCVGHLPTCKPPPTPPAWRQPSRVLGKISSNTYCCFVCGRAFLFFIVGKIHITQNLAFLMHVMLV